MKVLLYKTLKNLKADVYKTAAKSHRSEKRKEIIITKTRKKEMRKTVS